MKDCDVTLCNSRVSLLQHLLLSQKKDLNLITIGKVVGENSSKEPNNSSFKNTV